MTEGYDPEVLSFMRTLKGGAAPVLSSEGDDWLRAAELRAIETDGKQWFKQADLPVSRQSSAAIGHAGAKRRTR